MHTDVSQGQPAAGRRIARLRCQRGQAALEFVLVLPLLFLAVVIAVEVFQVFGALTSALVEHRNDALTEAVEYNDTSYNVETRKLRIQPVQRQVPVLGGLRGVFPNGITVRSSPDDYWVYAGTGRSKPRH
jgi:hypothetical protein